MLSGIEIFNFFVSDHLKFQMVLTSTYRDSIIKAAFHSRKFEFKVLRNIHLNDHNF